MFLSRTGAAKPEAREFVEMLRSQGVNAKVVKGDVTSLKDVKAAVAASDKPIKGVIQGALTLHVRRISQTHFAFQERWLIWAKGWLV